MEEQREKLVKMFGQWVLDRIVENDDSRFSLKGFGLTNIEDAAIDMGLLDWDDQKQRCVHKKKEH